MDRAKPSAADFFFLIPLKKYTGTFPGGGKQAIASRSCKSFLLWGRWGNSLVRNSVEYSIRREARAAGLAARWR